MAVATPKNRYKASYIDAGGSYREIKAISAKYLLYLAGTRIRGEISIIAPRDNLSKIFSGIFYMIKNLSINNKKLFMQYYNNVFRQNIDKYLFFGLKTTVIPTPGSLLWLQGIRTPIIIARFLVSNKVVLFYKDNGKLKLANKTTRKIKGKKYIVIYLGETLPINIQENMQRLLQYCTAGYPCIVSENKHPPLAQRFAKGTLLSHVGLVRKNNEDSGFIVSIRGLETPYWIAGVADGAGGMAAGEYASIYAATEFINSTIKEILSNNRNLQSILHIATYNANKAVNTLHEQGINAASTLSAGLFTQNNFSIINVGDSRSYQYTKGKLIQLTRDHCLPPPRHHILTRALGGSTDEKGEHFGPYKLIRPSKFIFASDGLHDLVPNNIIQQIIASYKSDYKAAQALLNLALKAGGKDNITITMLDFS